MTERVTDRWCSREGVQVRAFRRGSGRVGEWEQESGSGSEAVEVRVREWSTDRRRPGRWPWCTRWCTGPRWPDSSRSTCRAPQNHTWTSVDRRGRMVISAKQSGTSRGHSPPPRKKRPRTRWTTSCCCHHDDTARRWCRCGRPPCSAAPRRWCTGCCRNAGTTRRTPECPSGPAPMPQPAPQHQYGRVRECV